MLKKINNIQENKSITVPNADPCFRCGYCCSKRPCSYGEIDGNEKCVFLKLVDEELMIFSCEKRDEIIDMEKSSNIPMFDNYCSSSYMNTVREAVIEKIKNDTH